MSGKRKTSHQGWGGWRPGVGRPALPEGERITVPIRFDVSPDDMARIEWATKQMGYKAKAHLLRHAVLHFVEELELNHRKGEG